jgi:hypothetical protein
MGSVGDIQSDPWEVTKARYDVAARYLGKVVAGIKPRPNENLIRVIRLAEAAKAFAITIAMRSSRNCAAICDSTST